MRGLLFAIITAAASAAQARDLAVWEDFENPEMSALKAVAEFPKGRHSAQGAISGKGSLVADTRGKEGYLTTLRIDAEKIKISGAECTVAAVSFKYKILAGPKGALPRNYFFCEKDGRRVYTEVFGTRVGESGAIEAVVRLFAEGKYKMGLNAKDGAAIAIDDFKIEREKSTSQREWLFRDGEFIGMKTPPTHQNFMVRGSPELKMDKGQFFPFIDKFGQYKHRNWEGKIGAESDFALRIKEEEAFDKSLKKIENRDKYFGLVDPKRKFEATGRFYTKKIGGKWWLITPEGNLFWSHGVDAVWLTSDTPTTGRERYFEDISDRRFIGVAKGNKHSYMQGKLELFDFNRRNLTIKYGNNFDEKYAGVVARRFAAWGLNTSGAWSSRRVMRSGKVPYTFLGMSFGARPFEGKFKKLYEFWRPMPDFFEPEFERQTRDFMARNAEFLRSPYCIGAFVDNEMPWQQKDGATAMKVLSCGKNQRAKLAFMHMLKEKYGGIARLNAAWKSSYKSWEDFLNVDNFFPKTAGGKADLLAFEIKYYERYFSVCRAAVKAAAPDALYLGCRFAWHSPAVVKAASRYCDVLSFNLYRDNVDGFSLPEGSVDKPIIIGEFHFGNQDRGVFGGGARPRKTMKERVDSYEKYVVSALENPAIIGAHWFRWFDQMATGRSDGENFSVGLLDICDTPVYPMILKAHELAGRLYEVRSKASTEKRPETAETITY